MKKVLLSILLLGISSTLMAHEPDETEIMLQKKIEWCQAQGQKLYTQSYEDNVFYGASLDAALKFFKLEREYIEELRWHHLFTLIADEFNDDWDWDDDDDDDDDDCDPRFKRAQLIKLLKRSK